jgi:hypothetical protein
MSLYPVTHFDYSEIDDVLERWASIYKIPILKEYKDDEVRAFSFVGQAGGQYQLWVDPINTDSSIEIHVWNYKNIRRDFICDKSELFQTLELAFNSIQENDIG